MKVVYIKTEKSVKRTEKELEEACKEKCGVIGEPWFISPYKQVPLKEPIYLVEMSMKELQLVSFYLELEKRKPIVNVELEAKLKQENKNE